MNRPLKDNDGVDLGAFSLEVLMIFICFHLLSNTRYKLFFEKATVEKGLIIFYDTFMCEI